MDFHVYVIKSLSTAKIYIGQTSDLKRRIKQHNDINCKLILYTKRNLGPWRLIYSEIYHTRAEAMKREKQLKSGKGRQWLHDNILSHESSLMSQPEDCPPQADSIRLRRIACGA